MPTKFPVLWQDSRAGLAELKTAKCPRSIPWDKIAPFERRAQKNHDQTLERLAQRGGLAPQEILAVINDVSWSAEPYSTMSNTEATQLLLEWLAKDTT